MTTDKLKPCPFCGAQAKFLNIGKNLHVSCASSDCPVNPGVFGYQSSDARYHVDPVERWNTRANVDTDQ